MMLRYFYGTLDLPQETNESRQDFFHAGLELETTDYFCVKRYCIKYEPSLVKSL